MRNLLFFDIDGTLITDDQRKVFPADAKAALQAARLAGNLVFINTGRVRCNVNEILSETKFDGMVCGCGTYIEYHGEVLLHRTIPKERCRELALFCRECRLQCFFEYADFCGYDPEVDLPYIRPVVEDMERKGYTFMNDISGEDFRFDKFSGWYDETSDVERFRRETAGEFKYIDRGPGFFEVEPRGFSKASGMQFLLEYFDLPFSCSYAFGDSNNDLEMLQYAAHSVCMEQGSELCRRQAEFVTTGVEQEGIRKALAHYGLFGK